MTKANLAISRMLGRAPIAACLALTAFIATITEAATITNSDILSTPSQSELGTGSGNGTLDMRLFTFSGSEIGNDSGSFNGDNGNNTLTNSGGSDTFSFTESYVTTAGDLKAYYDLNFQPGSIDEIVLFLDLNETGATPQLNNGLTTLDIIFNPISINGSPNPAGDVTSAEQAAINQSYTGGSTIANLDGPKNLPVNEQGAGFADYAIFTGINPFALNDADVLLFNISMDTLNNGAEEIFLDGTYSGDDIRPPVSTPVPAAVWLFGSGLVGLISVARRKTA